MLNQIEKVVVVAGCQRSGTTLVGQILGAHPKAILIDETDGLYDWFPAFASNANGHQAKFRKMLESADLKYRPNKKRCVAKSSALRPTITHLILKAPNLTYSYELISKLRRSVSIVYPTRDARAVVASMAKLPHFPFVERQLGLIKTHDALARELSSEIEAIESNATNIAVKRALIWNIKTCLQSKFIDAGLPVFTFKYERLVADSKNICTLMIKHVGLDYNEQILNHGNVYLGMGPGKTRRSRPIDQASINKWQNRMSAGEEREILEVTSSTMTALGYDLSIPRVQTGAWWKIFRSY